MKIKKRFKLIFLLIILGIGGYYIYNSNIKKNNTSKPEDSKTVKLMKENNIPEGKYSKTLEYVLLNDLYDEKYLDEYKDINLVDNDSFKDILITFLPKGYKGKEINYLFKISSKNLAYLKENDYVDISKYYEFKNFDASKVSRYDAYAKDNNYSLKDVVTYVNIKLDLPVYTDTVTVDDPDSLNVIVNKYNGLPKNYTPSDLVYVDGAYGNQVPFRKVIKDDFVKLQEAAKKEININLLPTTAFRNQNFQSTLYNNYVSKDGVAKADQYSARPGFSEHQTGLAIDLKNTALKDVRLTDDNFEWLSENAYKYGFIIRYPKDKEYITGYQFENWHIRYVGYEAAKIIHDENLCLEEYIDLYITEY